MSEKKEEKKEAIKPILVVPWVDKYGRAVIKTTNRQDAETLDTALDNRAGILVQGPVEDDKVCPAEPDKPYDESICKIIDDLFKKGKERKEKSETKQKRSNTNSQGCICSDF